MIHNDSVTFYVNGLNKFSEYANVWATDSTSAAASISNYVDYTTYSIHEEKELKMNSDFLYLGDRYIIDEIQKDVSHGYDLCPDVELTIHAHQYKYGIDVPNHSSKKRKNVKCYKPFEIKKIFVNPEKSATTVLWADGTHTTVKRSEGDDPADIWSVVSYALAEKVYGSNSAFKREVKGKVEHQGKKVKEKPMFKDLGDFLDTLFREVKK